MLIKTSRFGDLDIQPNSIIHFPSGIPGFLEVKRFVLLDIREYTEIGFLQAIDDCRLAFAVIDPTIIYPGYQVLLGEEDIINLEITEEDELQYLSILTIPSKVEEMTANLLAPVVINPRKMLGRQVIQTSSNYSIRHKILPVNSDITTSQQKGKALRKIG